MWNPHFLVLFSYKQHIICVKWHCAFFHSNNKSSELLMDNSRRHYHCYVMLNVPCLVTLYTPPVYVHHNFKTMVRVVLTCEKKHHGKFETVSFPTAVDSSVRARNHAHHYMKWHHSTAILSIQCTKLINPTKRAALNRYEY